MIVCNVFSSLFEFSHLRSTPNAVCVLRFSLTDKISNLVFPTTTAFALQFSSSSLPYTRDRSRSSLQAAAALSLKLAQNALARCLNIAACLIILIRLFVFDQVLLTSYKYGGSQPRARRSGRTQARHVPRCLASEVATVQKEYLFFGPPISSEVNFFPFGHCSRAPPVSSL